VARPRGLQAVGVLVRGQQAVAHELAHCSFEMQVQWGFGRMGGRSAGQPRSMNSLLFAVRFAAVVDTERSCISEVVVHEVARPRGLQAVGVLVSGQ
jgi:hypothetical protein